MASGGNDSGKSAERRGARPETEIWGGVRFRRIQRRLKAGIIRKNNGLGGERLGGAENSRTDRAELQAGSECGMPGIRVQHRFRHGLYGFAARRAVVEQRVHDLGERKQQCSQKQQGCGETGTDGIHEITLV